MSTLLLHHPGVSITAAREETKWYKHSITTNHAKVNIQSYNYVTRKMHRSRSITCVSCDDYKHVTRIVLFHPYLMAAPFKVKPNPLACHFFLQRTYSENPPGPAQISAKYNSSLCS